MRIVFIVGSYHPNYSAVGKCVGNVVEVLAKDHKVTVICEKTALNQQEQENYQNHKILRAVTPDKFRRLKVLEQIKRTSGVNKIMFQVLLHLIKLQNILKLLFSKTSVKDQLVSAYFLKLKEIDNIDLIVSASLPFESLIAAYNYKEKVNSDVKLISYLFDQFAENETLHRFKFNKILKKRANQSVERDILRSSERTLIMKQLSDYFLSNHSSYEDKLQKVEHPLVVKIGECHKISEVSSTVFTYTGSFYKNIRSPQYMLKVFDQLLQEGNQLLNLYTFGNCEDIISEYSSKNNFIKANGSISTKLVNTVLNESDFLVAVGNSIANQIPSKIFEYLSYGKPIIYFFDNPKDLSIEILKKYPNSICIDQKNMSIENAASILREFSINNKNKMVAFESIAELYPDALPEYTAEIIEEIVKK